MSSSPGTTAEKTEKHAGRKKFYEYFCPVEEKHETLMFKNKHLCKECTESKGKHCYMHKRCKYCKEDMKSSEKHFYKCEAYKKT